MLEKISQPSLSGRSWCITSWCCIRSLLIFLSPRSMEKTYRYRAYLTPEQEQLLRRTMGCARLVYNLALAARTEAWYERSERIDYAQTSTMLTSWKKEEELNFLNEVSSVPLQQGLRNLQKAFTNFWAGRAKYPSFKKKHNGGSAEFTARSNCNSDFKSEFACGHCFSMEGWTSVFG